MSTDALNIIVGFGGVLLLGLIGFLYVWFTTTPAKRDTDPTSRPKNPVSRP